MKFNYKHLLPIFPLYTLPKASETLKSNIQLGFPQLSDPGSPTHIEVLGQWIQDCDQKHQCLHSQDTPFVPTRLIHVGNNVSERVSLICETEKLAKETKYLALSHRWGSGPNSLASKIVCTDKSNVDWLCHGFDDSELPPMFLDAILIARELKVEYLWIDSLCIIQKDEEDWKKESELMEQVFRSAYATLAATCASSPAERFLKTRPERQCVTMKADGELYYLCDDIDDFDKDVEQGELNKRGWVFQERALSRRTIYFAEKQTYWECGKGIRCETLTKTSNSKASFLGDANFPYSMPNYVKGEQIVLFQELFERYSKLALTVDTDRPVAIRGLENRLMRVLKTKGKFGIFELHLRRSLLWERVRPSLQRIDFSKKKEQETVPSWSWMAYNGEIRYMGAPFEGMEWRMWDQDIVSPWKTGKEDSKTPLELDVIVRDLTALPSSRQVFLDEPKLNDDRSFKCVIIGSSKDSSQGKGQVYYTLIVTPLAQGEANVYERAGVASMHKHHIVLDKSGTKARLR